MHGFNHRKPYKSIVGRDDNVLYIWSMLFHMQNHSVAHETTGVCI